MKHDGTIRNELERYEFLKKLGEGGNGSVHLVQDLYLQRKLAVKMIEHAEIGFFYKEVDILKKAGMKLLPIIYDAWIMSDGVGIIVMEYIQGKNLYEYLQVYTEIDEACMNTWALELASFLCQLHESNTPMLYRDLKPENIMICENMELRIVDFGTAVCLEQGTHKDGMRVGTKGFAAPEQWNGGWSDARSDIYSLGAILKLLWEHCSYQSMEMEKIIRKCMQELPEHRYRTAESLLRDIRVYPKKEQRRLLWERTVYALRIFFLLTVVYCLFFYKS